MKPCSSRLLSILPVLFVCGTVFFGCHAAPDDAKGQAKEVADPVRRENAISNLSRLYAQALSKASGNRQADSVKAIADVSVESLSALVLEHGEDSRNTLHALDILLDMRDPRSVKALIKSVDWRPEVSEEHAIRAAKALGVIPLGESDKTAALTAITSALDRIKDSRPIDNRMRIEFLTTLGTFGDVRATPALIKIATRQTQDQNFLINRYAVEQLGKLRDPAAVPTLIRALFMFDPNNPGLRMNDVASFGLVQIGRPSLNPLLKLLKGDSGDVKPVVQSYIQAVKTRDAEAASKMSIETITVSEASYALGQLGFHEALAPLLEETRKDNATRRLAAAIAIISVRREPADEQAVREALVKVYQDARKVERPQLLAAMQHSFDRKLLPFFLEQAKKPEEDLPDIRVIAARAYAFLAGKEDVGALRDLIHKEPGAEEGGFRKNFEENNPLLDIAKECGENIACYQKRLSDKKPMVVRKAATMLGALAEGNLGVVSALLGVLDQSDELARADALYAIDAIAIKGSPETVAAIAALGVKEEGRASWNRLKSLALSVSARLSSRARSGT